MTLVKRNPFATTIFSVQGGRYTKVTYASSPTRWMMGWSGAPNRQVRSHASETIGRPHAWSMFARVLLAAAGRRWPLLPGLPALRCWVQIRLETDAAG